ncbi:MAG: FG-GAP-like repeat-containing protein [Ferruginibacter sp.]
MKRYFLKNLLLPVLILFSVESQSQVLLNEGFEGSFPPSGWTLENPGFVTPFTQNTFVTNAVAGTKSLRCYASPFATSNAWALTPAFNLTTNTLYRISYWYRGSTSSGFSEKMKVTIGNAATAASQTTIVHNYPAITSTSFAQGIDVITVPANGNYNIGFNYYSEAGQAVIYIDEIIIEQLIPTACSGGIPSIGTASGPSMVYPGSTFTLSLSGNYLYYSGLQFQWQSSIQGANNFSNIAGATSQNYITSQTEAKDYRCIMTCTNGGSSSTSNLVTVFLPGSGALFREKHIGDISLTSHIYGMHFLTPSTGFVAFADSVGFTQDSGHTYIKRGIGIANTNFNGFSNVNLTFGFSIRGVYAFSVDSLLLYGDYGAGPAILFSANQGVNWKLVFHQEFGLNPDLNNSMYDMKFLTTANGIAINQKYIIETLDRGQTWTIKKQVAANRSSNLAKLAVPSATSAYAVAGDYVYQRLAGSWFELAQLPDNPGLNYNNIAFSSQSRGYIVRDDNGAVYMTVNSGSSWAKMNDQTISPAYASDIYFTNDSTGFIASAQLYNVLKTTDYGRTWEFCKRNSSYQVGFYEMDRLFFLNSQTGWAGGRGEYLMITTTGGNPTIPKAIGRIDTTGLTPTGNVSLFTGSKSYYQHQWFKNGLLISTSLNPTYTHDIFSLRDTIMLVVSNGVDKDTTYCYQDFNPPVLPAPDLVSFNPATGASGTAVNLTGTGFQYVSSVSFGGMPAQSFIVNSATSITAIVGAGTSGNVKLITYNGKDSLPGFVHTGPPVITSFYPNEGGPGTPISIYGYNLNNVSAVNFGSTGALFYQGISATRIIGFVGTGNSGSISVTTNNGTVSMSGFRFIPNPLISSFSPELGPIGTTVTILGSNFSLNPDSNTVFFGAIKANVITAASGQLTVKVPLGATYSPLTVTTNGLTAFASRPLVVTFPGGGAGFNSNSFSDKTIFPANYLPTNICINDADGDGKPDIEASNQDGAVSLYRNTGSPGNISLGSRTNFILGGAPQAMVCGDLNGDGKQDIVTANNLGGSATVLRNTSSNGNISFANKVDFIVNHQAKGVVLADFNLDGKPDFAVANSDISYSKISIYKNIGYKDTISFDAKVDFDCNSAYIRSADFDGDGKTDIVTSSFGILKNISTLANISFVYDGTYYDGEHEGLYVGDLNGDGKLDIIGTKNSSNYLAVLINNSAVGNISFLPMTTVFVGNFPAAAMIADLDGDGKPDIALVTNNTQTIEGSRMQVLKNTSVGTNFSLAPQVEYYIPRMAGVEAGDIDLDGKPDIVCFVDGTLAVLRNQIGTQINLCAGGDTLILSSISGASYQWQLSTDNVNFNNLSNNANYTGVNTNILHLSALQATWYGYKFRCLVNGNSYSDVFSIAYTNRWTGAASNVWENPANWSCGTVPDANTDVRIPSGTIVINSNIIIRSLILTTGVQLTVNPGFTVTIIH